MTFSPGLRTAVLTTHVVTSVGWLGAVLAYLVLDVTAVTSHDIELVRVAYGAMELVVVSAIVPLALAAVVLGVVNALGTTWGLFRHWWVVVKLVLTLVATVVLLLQVPTVRMLAASARSAADPRELPGTLAHSIGGLLVLVVVAALSTYKPKGLTRYGWRRQQAERARRRGVPSAATP